MREQVIKQINSLNLSGFRLSKEHPYDESGVALYLKNPRTVYVEEMEVSTDPLFGTLSGHIFNTETVSVRVYLSTDAKSVPLNYPEIITRLRAVKDTIDFPGASRRDCSVQTEYSGDLFVTQLEYRLTRLN
jgi:hypothetical protein